MQCGSCAVLKYQLQSVTTEQHGLRLVRDPRNQSIPTQNPRYTSAPAVYTTHKLVKSTTAPLMVRNPIDEK